MENRYLMTAFGKDRPGIVADVTGVLFENGCNLEETTMTLLADEFTLIMLFSSTNAEIEVQLTRECRRLEKDKGISAFLRPLQQRREISKVPADYILHVEGEDQAGIVYKISRYLADEALNIIDLRSEVRPSPQSGAPLYVMDIHIQAPATDDREGIEEGLAQVADELNVDITLS